MPPRMADTSAGAFLRERAQEAAPARLHRLLPGVAVSLWIFSGTWFFLSIFAMFAVIAQNEYYDMARENGCYPTWKLGLLGSVGMYVAACSTNPILRDALFPLTGTVTVVYLLLRQEPKTPPTTMNDISSTFVSAGRRRIHTHRKRTTSTLTPCLSLLLASLSDGHLLLRLHALLLDPLALPRPVNNAHTTARGPPRRFTRLRLADHTEVIGLVCRLVYLGCLSPMVDDVLDRHSGRYITFTPHSTLSRRDSPRRSLYIFMMLRAQSSPTLRARTLARRLSSPSARGRPGRASGADASVRWPRSAGVRLSCDGLDRCSRAPSMASCAR